MGHQGFDYSALANAIRGQSTVSAGVDTLIKNIANELRSAADSGDFERVRAVAASLDDNAADLSASVTHNTDADTDSGVSQPPPPGPGDTHLTAPDVGVQGGANPRPSPGSWTTGERDPADTDHPSGGQGYEGADRRGAPVDPATGIEIATHPTGTGYSDPAGAAAVHQKQDPESGELTPYNPSDVAEQPSPAPRPPDDAPKADAPKTLG